MAEVARIIPASRDAVFAALAEPDTYPRWVVGAQRIRAVEGNWPAPGATFHHVVGAFPLRLRDSTSVLECAEGRLLVLEARARPMGRARVELHLEEVPGGTRVRMVEFPTSGPARFAPDLVLAPSIRRRNHVSLERLEAVVTGSSD
ncbi:SRPBCC domain-containing protein [Egicoccus sp. AB-alg6-2]|uniref:SRPBCC family protein n=1 Tax=Egicoccus sp. AB-alg6-2 TaxID=3242692 RepID=UPI00359D4EE9